MNVEEQVATLEALLARVKKNAAMPRAQHRADVGAPLARAPEAAVSAGAPAAEPAGPKPAPAEIAPKPVEITPRPAPVEIALKAPEPAEKPGKGLTTTLIGTPGASKAPAAKPAEKAAPAKPVAATAAPRVPIPTTTLKPMQPKPADAGTPRAPVVAPARPTTPATPAARPPLPSRPPVEAAPPVVAEKTPPVEKAEPVHVAPRVEEPAKAEPIQAVEKAEPAPVKAAEKPAEKAVEKPVEKPVSTLKAPDENELLFNFDTEPVPAAKRAEPAAKPAEKPVEKPVAKPAEKPAEKRPAASEEEEFTDEETKLMVGPIPDAARPPPGDEITVDDDTRIVSMPEAAKAAEKAPPRLPVAAAESDDEPESEEVTRLMEPGERLSDPMAEAQRVAKAAAELHVAAPKIEAEKVVVSAAARAPVPIEELAVEPPPLAPIAASIPSAIIEDHPVEPREPTSPSRRYEPPPEALPPVDKKPGARAPLWGFAIAAVLLLAAAVVVGMRNGWFESSAPGPVLSGVPIVPSGSAPAIKNTGTAVPGTTTSASGAVSAAEPGTTAPAIDTTVPSGSASAPPATSASAPPATSASAAPPGSTEPTAKPAPEGDGSALAPNKGYLVVASAKSAGVFLTGNFAGLTGEKLEVDCGVKFLRLGVAPADGNLHPAEVTWISDGKTTVVACRATTSVTLEAK